MKKSLITLTLITGLSMATQAQDVKPANEKAPKKEHGKGHEKNQTPEERAKHGANWAEKKLGLNADQKTKWEAAALERNKSNAPLHDKLKGSTTPEERKSIHEQIKSNTMKFDETVNGFLSDEQKATWRKIKEEKRKQRMDKVKAGKKKAEDVEIEDDDHDN